MNSFNTLTEAEKAERLAAYAAEDAKLGTNRISPQAAKLQKINELKTV